MALPCPTMAPRPKSVYRHVWWRADRQLWIVRRRGQASPGQSKTELGAAKIAAEAFGCTVASLRVQPRPPSPKARPRRYKHVFWLQEGKCWVVVRRGFPSPGTAKEQHVAAELAAKAFGCTVASLELQPKTLKPARRYRFVHYHSKDRSGTWRSAGSMSSASTPKRQQLRPRLGKGPTPQEPVPTNRELT